MTVATERPCEIRWLVLDAMGVIYRAGDDVVELLIPYLRGNGCQLAGAEIEDLYLDASVGRMTSSQFWQRCGVGGSDADYIAGHSLLPGLKDLLEEVTARGIPIACLSNDVSEWAVTGTVRGSLVKCFLRRRLGDVVFGCFRLAMSRAIVSCSVVGWTDARSV